MKRNVRKLVIISLLLIVTFLLAGCTGPKEHEVTPQQFVFGFEELKREAAHRTPIAIVERSIVPGTMFAVRVLDRISSATSNAGDMFRIEVLEDVVVDGAVVIPVGSVGQGKVVDARKAGIGGRSGDISIRFDFVRTYDDVRVAIEWQESAKRQDQDITFGEYLFFGSLAFFKTGENIAIPVNSQFYVLTRAPSKVMARIY